MNAIETIRYLQAGGFFGAQCNGTPEVMFYKLRDCSPGVIEIYVDDKLQRSLSQEAFKSDYANASFRRVQPTDAIA